MYSDDDKNDFVSDDDFVSTTPRRPSSRIAGNVYIQDFETHKLAQLLRKRRKFFLVLKMFGRWFVECTGKSR